LLLCIVMNQEEQFKKYAELIKKWNEKINITSIDDDEGIRTHHFEDSLAAKEFVSDTRTLIDLGTGAGLPGIPLKIALPDLEVVLIDARRKKISFCQEVIRALDLEKIRAIDGRAEDPYVYRELGTFDIVISRATWSLDVFVAIAAPYMNGNSKCIAMRGANWKADLEEAEGELKRHKLSLEKTHEYIVGKGDKRCILVFRKRS
jgi:16S rRNA (guanine527-N7)-methyltransferase